jgi:hypothetical protein
MNIQGVLKWDDRSTYYTQTNNSVENMLHDMGVSAYLETCGPTAAVNCLAAMGYDLTITCPGGWVPQPEDILEDFMTDPRNDVDFKKIRADINLDSTPGNRVPQFYPFSVSRVFKATGEFLFGSSFSFVASKVASGHAVQICLKVPGHYLAVVAYDPDTKELIYRDPWPQRVATWAGDGFNRRMGEIEWANVKGFYIVYT